MMLIWRPALCRELDPNMIPMPFNQDAFELKDLGLKSASVDDSKKQATGSEGTSLCFAIEWDDGKP